MHRPHLPVPPSPATTIDEVVRTLERLIDDAISIESRLGYFAVLYLRMTLAVRQKIVSGGFFQDAARMEQLDVNFANLYFRALNAYLTHARPVPMSWRLAFEACDDPSHAIIQHLYAGLSAHQILDLGQAAADTAPGQNVFSLRRDFEKVNEVVAEMMEDVDHSVGRASPWFGLLDRFAALPWAFGNKWAIRAAREVAWGAAEDIAEAQSGTEVNTIVARLDRDATLISRNILRPNVLGRAIVKVVVARERKSVPEVIRILRGA